MMAGIIRRKWVGTTRIGGADDDRTSVRGVGVDVGVGANEPRMVREREREREIIGYRPPVRRRV